MPDSRPISYPAGYVTSTAVGFADPVGNLSLVSAASALPVVQTRSAAPAALAGQTSGSLLAGPFAPLRDVPIHLQLSGTWVGTVTVVRSADGGATRQSLTVGGQPWGKYTANANEVVWQEGEVGATFYLDIALTSGSVAYRVSQ
ncbi:MAG: hypothetical protein RIS94_773 [Pseudomonadota bacterium]|jgi:hypothetical protein